METIGENYVTETTEPDQISTIKDEIVDNESTKSKNSHYHYFSSNFEASEQKPSRKNSVIAWAKNNGRTGALRAHFDSKKKDQEEEMDLILGCQLNYNTPEMTYEINSPNPSRGSPIRQDFQYSGIKNFKSPTEEELIDFQQSFDHLELQVLNTPTIVKRKGF